MSAYFYCAHKLLSSTEHCRNANNISTTILPVLVSVDFQVFTYAPVFYYKESTHRITEKSSTTTETGRTYRTDRARSKRIRTESKHLKRSLSAYQILKKFI